MQERQERTFLGGNPRFEDVYVAARVTINTDVTFETNFNLPGDDVER